MKYAIAALLGTTQAVSIKSRDAVQDLMEQTPYAFAESEAEGAPKYPGSDFDPSKVQHCPNFDERFTLVDGRTRAVAYPNPGWNCHQGLGLSEVEGAPKYPGNDFDPSKVQHCPNFDERFTLVDGRTRAVAYPNPGWNCHQGLGLSEAPKYPGSDFDPSKVQHCPNFDERFTLVDGRTRAVPYPNPGWNCHQGLGLSEAYGAPKYPGSDFDPSKVQHCPNFDERFTLVDGRTRAVAYPNPGWNCHQGLGLSEGAPDKWPGKDFDPRNVEHCPDFDERFTLSNGRTYAVPYPRKGWNCHRGLGLSEGAPKYPGNDFDPSKVQHCPNFDERFTLVDGRTRAIPYPLAGWNCHQGLGLAALEVMATPFNPRSVEHCPDFDERFTLNDGRTRAVPYPKAGWNCNPEWSLAQPIPDMSKVEHCPDFNERHTLKNGVTYAVAYPHKGWNCQEDY